MKHPFIERIHIRPFILQYHCWTFLVLLKIQIFDNIQTAQYFCCWCFWLIFSNFICSAIRSHFGRANISHPEWCGWHWLRMVDDWYLFEHIFRFLFSKFSVGPVYTQYFNLTSIEFVTFVCFQNILHKNSFGSFGWNERFVTFDLSVCLFVPRWFLAPLNRKIGYVFLRTFEQIAMDKLLRSQEHTWI